MGGRGSRDNSGRFGELPDDVLRNISGTWEPVQRARGMVSRGTSNYLRSAANARTMRLARAAGVDAGMLRGASFNQRRVTREWAQTNPAGRGAERAIRTWGLTRGRPEASAFGVNDGWEHTAKFYNHLEAGGSPGDYGSAKDYANNPRLIRALVDSSHPDAPAIMRQTLAKVVGIRYHNPRDNRSAVEAITRGPDNPRGIPAATVLEALLAPRLWSLWNRTASLKVPHVLPLLTRQEAEDIRPRLPQLIRRIPDDDERARLRHLLSGV